MKAVVFSGPSLPPIEVRRITDAEWRPPAAQGDLFRSAEEGFGIIGLIDGYFDWVPAVWHKEVLWALTQGIHVIGAASMGALRAAELEAFGMIGVGRVFEAFRSGSLEDDDEVAVLHWGAASENYAQITEAMVDIRATLQQAVAADKIGQASAAALERIAKRLHYKQRTYPRIFKSARAGGIAPREISRFKAWLGNGGRVSVKRADALELIGLVNDYLRIGRPRQPVTYKLEQTTAWQRVLASFQQSEPAVKTSNGGPENNRRWS